MDNEQLLSDPQQLLDALLALRREVCQEGQALYARWQPFIRQRAFLPSALNLAYYIALRRRDIRHLQMALMSLGVSSLWRSEGRVMPNLDAAIATLGAICGRPASELPKRPSRRAFFRGQRLLDRNTQAILGEPPAHRQVRIMVTQPVEAATDPALVKDLMVRGMECARINCAHDGPEQWAAMIGNIRRAEQETGRRCRVLMDLGGPKVRTGEVRLPKGRDRVQTGDTFLLVREHFVDGKRHPMQVACTLPQVLDHLRVGDAVWMDDGRMGSVVEELLPEGALLRVTVARIKGEKLRPDRGLNFPDTYLPLSPLTSKDLKDLDFVVREADMVGYSFVQEPQDIDLLLAEIARRETPGRLPLGIVAKIETPRAIQNLPELMVRAGGQRPFAVMLARGDLAVEIGYERLSEMQEEILWLCEAAAVPVIWATQVLENMAKKGIPSRAEITDAAMAERAECVMLNKGPFIGEAVTLLDDVLTRLQAHQSKKTAQLRALRSW
jgi:pyruvate kinase